MFRLFLLLFCLQTLTACADFPVPLDDTPEQEKIAPTPLLVSCDTCRYPVVMAHGFLASGDTWTPFQQLFTSNGYKPNRIFAFDWNSLAQTANHAAALDAFIDRVLAKTGAPKVRLIGHSAGGGLGYTYLSVAARAAKVDAYVHVASSVQPAPAGPGGSVPTLNLWSEGDKIVQGGNISGATNAQIPAKDHYEVATSPESFAAIWRFFHGKEPQYLSPIPENIVCITGRALTFGENAPAIGTTVQIYEINPATGQRVNAQPFETLTCDSLGYWKPINVPANTTFEFVVTTGKPNDRVVHYFREGFTHLNSFVYLRVFPPATSLAGLLLAGLPRTNTQSVVNVFSSRQAIIQPRDTLLVNNTLVSTPQFATPQKTAISFFLYDDGDNTTELTAAGLFGNFSFLAGVDMFFPTTPEGFITLKMNQRTLRVRNIPSSQGVIVGVFN
jgi:pimeloyl-ACP methyl ester carboxylesterase